MRTLVSTTMTAILALGLAGADASAQGFPGGGGHAGGRGMGGAHGTHPPPGTPPSAARPAANPLVVFLQGLGGLRTELLVRTEQVDAWSAMRDALIVVADTERDAAAPRPVANDASLRLDVFVDGLRRRADAAKAASERIEAVIGVLDERQKPAFLARLADAFGTGESPPTP
jgi:hypothetical protein